MKVLIVYASRMGATRECAYKLGDMFGDNTDVLDLEKEADPDISGYDTVIIGSPVYMGRLNSRILGFCQKHMDSLAEKKLGIFICCFGVMDGGKGYLLQFPERLRAICATTDNFGGRIIMDKLSMEEKKILSMMGIKRDISSVKENKMHEFFMCLDLYYKSGHNK